MHGIPSCNVGGFKGRGGIINTGCHGNWVGSANVCKFEGRQGIVCTSLHTLEVYMLVNARMMFALTCCISPLAGICLHEMMEYGRQYVNVVVHTSGIRKVGDQKLQYVYLLTR